tara:strand:+ start:375 stop:701 length:327 start_codon:yes stop_codon:yes gene_type:complete
MTLEEEVQKLTEVVNALSGEVEILHSRIRNRDQAIDALIRRLEVQDSTRSIRRRTSSSTSVKGIKKIEGTIETTNYTEEEHWAVWDSHDAAVEARQPRVQIESGTVSE